MKPDPAQKFAECAELSRHNPGLTDVERREFSASVARQRAEDDRRRQPSPQLELGEAA